MKTVEYKKYLLLKGIQSIGQYDLFIIEVLSLSDFKYIYFCDSGKWLKKEIINNMVYKSWPENNSLTIYDGNQIIKSFDTLEEILNYIPELILI